MPRISHKTAMDGFDHVARLLKDAAGNNGVLSRAEAKKLVKDLKEEGRTTEAVAADNLYKMLDERDSRVVGARVTGADIDEIRTYVKTRMLENRDVNRDGYSAAEIRRMSATGRSLVEIGAALKAGSSPGVPVSAFKKEFEKLVTPHWNPSALPNAPRSVLPQAARADMASRRERESDLIDAPIARKLNVDGQQAFAIAQFMHDSFAVTIYDGDGNKIASGDGWGSPNPVDWQ